MTLASPPDRSPSSSPETPPNGARSAPARPSDGVRPQRLRRIAVLRMKIPWLFVGPEHDLRTPLTPAECRARLLNHLGQGQWWGFQPRKNDSLVRGAVWSRRFWVVKNQWARDSWVPFAYGSIDSAKGGSKVSVRFSIFPLTI